LIVAERGKGAYLNGQKLVVSTETSLINSLIMTDNSSSIPARQKNLDLLLKFSPFVRHTRIFGSAAWAMARIAQGQIDIYYKQHFNYWDYAAGIVIVQEAGGIVSDMDGQPISIKSTSILAANAALHSEALAFIQANNKDLT
jgi:myo-inositol-1(or 4)-monophosphatase